MFQRCQVLLLALVLLLAGVESAPTTTSLRPTNSDNSTFTRSRIAGEHGAPMVQRLLRTDNTLNGADEERAISIKPIAALDKFKAGVENIISAYKSKITLGTLLKWAKEKKSPESVFATLKLDKATTLADNPNFMVWFGYARYVWADDVLLDNGILNFLTQSYKDVKLARMLEPATQTKGTKDIATTLQNLQFDDWMRSGEDVWEKFGLTIPTLFSRNKAVSTAIWIKYEQYKVNVNLNGLS